MQSRAEYDNGLSKLSAKFEKACNFSNVTKVGGTAGVHVNYTGYLCKGGFADELHSMYVKAGLYMNCNACLCEDRI